MNLRQYLAAKDYKDNPGRLAEDIIHLVFLVLGLVAVGSVLVITVYLVVSGLPAILKIGPVEFLFGTRWGIFGTGLGGQAGIAAAEWLRTSIGTVGLGMMIIMCWILLAVYINRSTIKVVNRVSSTVAKGTADLIGRLPSIPHKAKDSNEEHRTSFEEQLQEDMEAVNYYYQPESQSDNTATCTNNAMEEEIEEPSVHASKSTSDDDDELSIVMPEEPESPFVEDNIQPAKSDTSIGDDEFILTDGPDLPANEKTYDRDLQTVDDDDNDFEVIDENGNRIKASSLHDEPKQNIKEEPQDNALEPVTLGAGGVVVTDHEGMEIVKTDYHDTEADRYEQRAKAEKPDTDGNRQANSTRIGDKEHYRSYQIYGKQNISYYLYPHTFATPFSLKRFRRILNGTCRNA